LPDSPADRRVHLAARPHTDRRQTPETDHGNPRRLRRNQHRPLRFTDAEGTVRITDPIEETTAEVRIATATLDTGVPARDRHLCSPEFLDTDRHPVMAFRGHQVRRAEDHWELDGDLTVAGITRPLTLTGHFLGQDVYPFTGGRRLGLTGHATLDRRDFGVSGLPPLPGVQIFVGADVDIELDISMVDHDIQPFNEQLLGRPQAL
jgi:polyisoprenoid-binding protein YceI